MDKRGRTVREGIRQYTKLVRIGGKCRGYDKRGRKKRKWGAHEGL